LEQGISALVQPNEIAEKTEPIFQFAHACLNDLLSPPRRVL
jgi:hypothetical protein